MLADQRLPGTKTNKSMNPSTKINKIDEVMSSESVNTLNDKVADKETMLKSKTTTPQLKSPINKTALNDFNLPQIVKKETDLDSK